MQTNNESIKEHDNQSADLTQPIDASGDIRADRSFDAIADHFEKKVYGGLKAIFDWRCYAVISLNIARE